MSKKPSPSYDNVTIAPRPTGEPQAAEQPPIPSGAPARRHMRDDAAPMTLYVHPRARKALKRYAMEKDVKVHDLMLEAVEDWFRAHGLTEPVRVQASPQR